MDLILCTVRYVLADARHWGARTRWSATSVRGACGNDAELLAARRERLQNEWAMYPRTLANYGLYTTVVE